MWRIRATCSLDHRWRMDKTTIGTLQVIFKIVERCNLNCQYCYYYSGADSKTDMRPPVISRDTIITVTEFLKHGCEDYSIANLSIIFHGGEPTLMKHALFDWMCDYLSANLSHCSSLSFSIQTNGVHMTQDWINVLAKHKVSVGVSIDGNMKFNDVYRLDHKGGGSHDRIYNNVKKLNAASSEGRIQPIGLVCVLNSEFDYGEIYQHFTRDLGVSYLNFLLPDRNRDADLKQKDVISRYGDVLCTLFDEWLEYGMENVEVRQFAELLSNFTGKIEYRHAPENYISNQIVVLHSDGDVAVDDTLMPAMDWYQRAATANVQTMTLKDWLTQSVFEDLREARSTLPTECRDCRWSSICRGGDVENRFSKSDGFAGKSVYCSAIMKLYDHVAETLIAGGYPRNRLETAIRGRAEQTLSGAT